MNLIQFNSKKDYLRVVPPLLGTVGSKIMPSRKIQGKLKPTQSTSVSDFATMNIGPYILINSLKFISVFNTLLNFF